ncbi:Co2+/Mg2+ efflux protein ApaG [Litoribacillus peritrichatus]|uniref:Protein ApaG n=1 Tax=Litoribacillus peritrichatus TaxID=718191 RepID=A0ABP7LWX5_9GAMM
MSNFNQKPQANNVHTESGIEIWVDTEYLPERSEPQKERYIFSYTVTIKNKGTQTTQLLSRYWHIMDANEQIHEVEGVGVVGKQPTLAPGQHFSYTSGTSLATPVGSMQGHYVMKSADGDEFNVTIAPFRLSNPSLIH